MNSDAGRRVGGVTGSTPGGRSTRNTAPSVGYQSLYTEVVVEEVTHPQEDSLSTGSLVQGAVSSVTQADSVGWRGLIPT